MNKHINKNSNFNKEKMINTRKEIGFSQEDVAELINVSRQTISAWESGKSIPTIDNISKLATLFKISISDLTYSNSSFQITSQKNQFDKTITKNIIKKTNFRRTLIISFLLIILLIIFIPSLIKGFTFVKINHDLTLVSNINNYHYKIFTYTLDKDKIKNEETTTVYFKNNIMKQIHQTKADTITHWINYNTNERLYVSRIK